MHEVEAAHQILPVITTPMIVVALLIFLGSYALIISEKVHRTIVAIFGSALAVFIGTLMGFYHQEEALHVIDFNTIGLLVGMMIIVAITKDTGIFQYLAIKAAKSVKGDPWKVMLVLGILTAVLSAFLDNVTTILLLVPMTFIICDNLKINPVPFLIVEILTSNIGGTATLIGDPPNILIGSAAKLSFLDFLVNLGPVVIVILVVVLPIFRWKYGKVIKAREEDRKRIMGLDEKASLKNPAMIKKSLFVLGLVLLGFFFHGALHLEAATIALLGAGLLLLLDWRHPEKALHEVEWVTIFFFIGLFVLVGALEEVGIISWAATKLIALTEGNLPLTASLILWGGAFFSAFIDNIPFVATMIPLIQDMHTTFNPTELNTIWWSLALGACLGGNGTLIGASANLVVSDLAKKAGYDISFKNFMKIGGVIMIISILISQAYLWLRYF